MKCRDTCGCGCVQGLAPNADIKPDEAANDPTTDDNASGSQGIKKPEKDIGIPGRGCTCEE